MAHQSWKIGYVYKTLFAHSVTNVMYCIWTTQAKLYAYKQLTYDLTMPKQ